MIDFIFNQFFLALLVITFFVENKSNACGLSQKNYQKKTAEMSTVFFKTKKGYLKRYPSPAPNEFSPDVAQATPIL